MESIPNADSVKNPVSIEHRSDGLNTLILVLVILGLIYVLVQTSKLGALKPPASVPAGGAAATPRR